MKMGELHYENPNPSTGAIYDIGLPEAETERGVSLGNMTGILSDRKKLSVYQCVEATTGRLLKFSYSSSNGKLEVLSPHAICKVEYVLH